MAGKELADPVFHPFWAKAEELGAVVFIHPQPAATPDLGNRLRGNGLLTNVIGNPLETTIALSHLIFEGTLDRFPGLKICAAHGGGYLPSYMNRSDHGCVTFPAQCKAGVPKEHPTAYVKRMYYDSLVFTPEALRHLVAEVGASQIVMGTDYPYPWVDAPVDHVLATPGLERRRTRSDSRANRDAAAGAAGQVVGRIRSLDGWRAVGVTLVDGVPRAVHRRDFPSDTRTGSRRYSTASWACGSSSC